MMIFLVTNQARAGYIAKVSIRDPSGNVVVTDAIMSHSCGTGGDDAPIPWSHSCDSFTYSYSNCSAEGDWEAQVKVRTLACTYYTTLCSTYGFLPGGGHTCTWEDAVECYKDETSDWNVIFNINWDANQADCECYKGTSPPYWNIGGESSATSCCEDATEARRESIFHASMDGSADGTDACCLTANGPKCVDANTCYNHGSTSHDADSDGDNDYCNSGTWYDCETDSECGAGYYCSSNDCVAKKNNGAACTANRQCISGICDLDGCLKCVSTYTDTDGDKYNDDLFCDACPNDPDDHGGASGDCEVKLGGLIVMDDRTGSSMELYAEGPAWTPDPGMTGEQSTTSFEGTYSTHNKGSWVRKATSFATATYPLVVFAYKIDNREIACLMIYNGTWKKFADTSTTCSGSYVATDHAITLINDGQWHLASVNISDVIGTVTWVISGGTGDIYLDNVYAIMEPIIYSKPNNTAGATPGTKLIVYSVCNDDDGASDISNHANLINYQSNDGSPYRGYYYCSGSSVIEAGGSYGQEFTEIISSDSSCWTKGDSHIMKAVLRAEGEPNDYGLYTNDISLKCQETGKVSCWKHNPTNYRVYTEAATPACESDDNNYDVNFLSRECTSDETGETYCNATMNCDNGHDTTTLYQCEMPILLPRGTIDTTGYDTALYYDLSFLTDISTTADACIMYDVYDSESGEEFDIYVGKTKVADAEGGGKDAWLRYKYYNVSSYVSVGQNLWEFDVDLCCPTYDNILFGWLISETGSGADGNASTSCCDAATDCVDDYVLNENWGCYNTGTQRDTGGGDGADLEECRNGVWYAQDADPTACTNLGNTWLVGGEASGFGGYATGSETECCGDDSGEYVIIETQGTDSPARFGDGTSACCDADTDCVEASTCYASGDIFDTEGVESDGYCNSGSWEGGDASQTVCEALGHTWLNARCCGDDPSSPDDDYENAGPSNSCCIDGVVVSSDNRASGYDNGIMCYDGKIYSCNSKSTFNFDTDYITGGALGSFYCTSSGWSDTPGDSEESIIACEEGGGIWFGGMNDQACCDPAEEFVASFVPEDHLITKLKFDEGVGVETYDRLRGFIGGLTGTSWEISRVVDGRALRFDGSSGSYVMMENYTDLQLDANLTIAFWMYPENIGLGRINPIDKSYGGEFALTIETDGGLSYYQGKSKTEGEYLDWKAMDPGSITNDTWYFVVITRNNNTRELKSYLNGKLINSTTYALNASYIPSKSYYGVMVGRGYTMVAVDGVVDEVRLYDQPLSEEDIQVLYRSYPEYSQSDLRLYLPLDSSASDFSGYRQTVTSYGTPDYTGDRKAGSGAVNFDGSTEYFNLTGDIGTFSEMTFTVWFKKNLNEGSQYILDTRLGESWWIIQDYTQVYCTDTSGNICIYDKAEIPGSQMVNNTWQLLAVTVSSEETRAYLNGELIDVGDGFSPEVAAGLQLGTRYSGVNKFHGSFDDLRIYDRVLSAGEITFLYQLKKWNRYICDNGSKTSCVGNTCANLTSGGDYYYCYGDAFRKYTDAQDYCESACSTYGGSWNEEKEGIQKCCSPIQPSETWCDNTNICSGGNYIACETWCDTQGGTIGSYTCTLARDFDCKSLGTCSGGVCPCALASTIVCEQDSNCESNHCLNFTFENISTYLGGWGEIPTSPTKICCPANECAYDANHDGTVESCIASGTSSVDTDRDGDSDYCYQGVWYECSDFVAENQKATDCSCSSGAVAVDNSTAWVCRVQPVNLTETPCGNKCDSDGNAGTDEMIHSTGLCSLTPDVCGQMWYESGWEGNTTTLEVLVNMSCPCDAYASCNVTLTAGTGIIYEGGFLTNNYELTRHSFSPNLDYGANNVTVNCTCSSAGQSCTRNLTPVQVQMDEEMVTETNLAGFVGLTNISLHNLGNLKTYYTLYINTTSNATLVTNSTTGSLEASARAFGNFYNFIPCSDVTPTWESRSNYTPIYTSYLLNLTDIGQLLTGTGTNRLSQCGNADDCTTCCSIAGACWAFGEASNFTCSQNICCGTGEHFMNGACCAATEVCCLDDDSCDVEEWCNNYTVDNQYYTGFFICADTKADGVTCTESRECINLWCGAGICADSNPVPLSEWYECEPYGGLLCDYEAVMVEGYMGPRGCNLDDDCSSGHYCYSPRHACLECPSTNAVFGGINMSNDGLCASENCIGIDLDCCASDNDCNEANWCDATSTCRACSTQKDYICASSNCVGTDPDCCSDSGDCEVGENCTSGTCIGNAGESCLSDDDCTGTLECVAGICINPNFAVIVPAVPPSGYYNATVGDTMKFTILVANSQQVEDSFTASISTEAGYDAAFARLDNQMSETFRLGSGQVQKMLLTVFAGRRAPAPSDYLYILVKIKSTTKSEFNNALHVKVDVRAKVAEGVPKAPFTPVWALLLAGLALGVAVLK